MSNPATDAEFHGESPENGELSAAGPSGPAELAASARDIAEFITGHGAALREYERRIEELEAELETSRTTAAETKTQLAAVLQLVDVLKPTA